MATATSEPAEPPRRRPPHARPGLAAWVDADGRFAGRTAAALLTGGWAALVVAQAVTHTALDHHRAGWGTVVLGLVLGARLALIVGTARTVAVLESPLHHVFRAGPMFRTATVLSAAGFGAAVVVFVRTAIQEITPTVHAIPHRLLADAALGVGAGAMLIGALVLLVDAVRERRSERRWGQQLIIGDEPG